MKCSLKSQGRRGQSGNSLAETLLALLITVITVSGTINGYIFTTTRAEWSAYSLAAQSLAMQRVEQVRAAKWDLGAYPPIDRAVATNFPVVVDVLDLPMSGTNQTLATSYTTVRKVSDHPPLKLVRVDCVWPFRNRHYTNTVSCYRAPDQ